jgi:hypothetical protein
MVKNTRNDNFPDFMFSAGRAMEGVFSRMVHWALAPPPHLLTELNRFQDIREKTLDILQQVTPQQAQWSPRPGTWSIVQIADHLLRSEELYREQFQRLIQMARSGKGRSIEIPFKEVDTSIAMVPREVMSMLEFPMRMANLFVPHALREALVRYPVISALNPRISDPRTGLTLEKLREDLAASVVETRKVFAPPLPANLERLTVNHPTMGNNNPVELFRILIAHEERHQEQITGIRKNPNFPSAAVRL